MSTVNGFQVGSETLKYNYESLDNYNTPNFSTSSSTTYDVGDYVMYNGKLYKCTTATTGGTWVSGSWNEAVLSDDVSDLTRQLSDNVTGLDTKAPVIINRASGAIASFNDGADSMPIRKIVATIEPVQSGTGDPSPDNVRPISGWTGANIVGTGKNMLNPQTFATNGRFSYDPETGVFSGSNYPTRSVKLGTVKESTQYTISFKYKGNTTSKSFFYIRYTDGTNSQEKSFGSTSYIPVVFVTDAGKTIDSLHISYGTVIDINIADFQIEEGTTASAYEPFGTTLPINWQSEAGTIYGGTVTLNQDGSADVVSDMKIRTYLASDFSRANWSGHGYDTHSGMHILAAPKPTDYYAYDAYGSGGIICDRLTYMIQTWAEVISSGLTNILQSNFNTMQLGIILSDEKTFEEEQQMLSGMQIAYKLTTPVTYHFDNVGKLYTFFGTNNVWCDTGDITELTYPADTKLFLTARDKEITGNIAPIENGATASQAYAQGAYFWHDTKFCKALTAIASGATFTLGTNYQETTVAAELLAAQN